MTAFFCFSLVFLLFAILSGIAEFIDYFWGW
jgi:hypothetical protein